MPNVVTLRVEVVDCDCEIVDEVIHHDPDVCEHEYEGVSDLAHTVEFHEVWVGDGWYVDTTEHQTALVKVVKVR